jgi:DNA-directed RNA polymerase specialized sigma24 family protein
MLFPDAPTSRPPAGAEGADASEAALLHELRRGERDGFVRYHELYRAPVHDLIWQLADDQDGAVALTDEAFATAYRRILLHDGRVDLRAWTYRAALDVCRDHLAESGTDDGAASVDGPAPPARLGRGATKDLGRRIAEAFATLGFEYRAVLLLHDVHGLTAAESAMAFGVAGDAAAALLFRAREAFREAFEGLSIDQPAGACRLAELAAVGAVGRGLPLHERLRLEEHAGYCRHCRRVLARWRAQPVGLALFIAAAPPAPALETPPVFAVRGAGDASRAAALPLASRAVARAARTVKGRTFAYVLAAACLALSAGLAVQHAMDGGSVVVVQSAGLSMPWLHAAKSPAGSSSSRRIVRPATHVRSSGGSATSSTAAGSAASTGTTYASASVTGESESSGPASSAHVSPSAVGSAGGQATGGDASSVGAQASAAGSSAPEPRAGRAAKGHGRADKGHGRAATDSRHGARAGWGHQAHAGRRHGDHAARRHQAHATSRHRGHAYGKHHDHAARHRDHAARRHGGKTGKKQH